MNLENATNKKQKNDFNFCPNCGKRSIKNVNMRKWLCPECNFELYNNVATAVGLIIKNSEGRILLEKRAKEPRKNFLAFPGGFVDPGETAEEAAQRECREEIGAEVASLKFIGSEPNTYEYRGIEYKTCDLFFEAKLKAGTEKNIFDIQKDEVQSLEFVKIENADDIENVPLAFESAKRILGKYLNRASKNLSF